MLEKNFLYFDINAIKLDVKFDIKLDADLNIKLDMEFDTKLDAKSKENENN